MSPSAFAAIADAIETDWPSIARPEQLPPPGDWSTFLYLGGRGAGKTRAAAEWVRSLAESARVGRIALVGPTAADARDTMVEGESGLVGICPNSNRPTFEPSKRRLTWPNGVQATLFSSEEPERLRGPQFGAAWCDELCAWRNVRTTWDNLQFGLRLGKKPRQFISTTPKPLKLLKEIIADPNTVVRRGTTYDNRENLAESFFSQIVRRYEQARTGRQELYAEILEDTPGALWSRELIDATRKAKDEIPPMRRIVVAIDPAVSAGENADETGVLVCGLGTDGHGYVPEDGSAKLLPIDWARRAVGLYRRWNADRLVAESNQGGLMVEQTVRTVDQNVSFKSVHASRGKITRAEPIAALFEQSRVHLAGSFPELEDELCSYTAGSLGSPDRLDAMVWALTDLMLISSDGMGFFEYVRRQHEAMMAEKAAKVARAN
jgi:phage terminase large subunit-like protein